MVKAKIHMDKFLRLIKLFIFKYDYDKYWKMYDYVYESSALRNCFLTRVKGIYYHYRIRKMEAFSQASIGLHSNGNGTYFAAHPNLPHGLLGDCH